MLMSRCGSINCCEVEVARMSAEQKPTRTEQHQQFSTRVQTVVSF